MNKIVKNSKNEAKNEGVNQKGGNTNMKTIKKAIGWLVVIGMIGVGIVSRAEANNPATVSLKVTVAPALSVAIGTATYSFGSMGVNEMKISTGGIPITNDSLGRTEDYLVSATTATALTPWSLNYSTNGADAIMVNAVLNTTAPSESAFYAVASTLTYADRYMSAANHGGDQNGNNVAVNALRNLWIKIISPTSTSVTAEQSITVTVTAADAGTF